MSLKRTLTMGVASGIFLALGVSPAFAQIEELVVTARKREEKLQEVPVTLTAYSSDQINQLGISGIEDLSALTPGLMSYNDAGGSQGVVSIRGIFTGSLNSGSSQAVSTNIDGIALNQGTSARVAQIDLGGVEVLKGPQALFFGKNATGGIISYRTADPTSETLIQGRLAYEPNANEFVSEFIGSGPITPELGARVVLSFSTMDGWFRNTAINPVKDRTAPDYDEFFVRGTLKWNPSNDFDARLKLSYLDNESNPGPRQIPNQALFCNRPAPFPMGEDCKLNHAGANPDPANGRGQYSDYSLGLASLEMNYSPTDSITLTSVTGYYEDKRSYFGNASPVDVLTLQVTTDVNAYSRAFSQELRATSEFDGPLNFMAGGYYDDGKSGRWVQTGLGGGRTLTTPTDQYVDFRTYSVFGQVIANPLDTVELSAGVRYSSERRAFHGLTFPAAGPRPIIAPVPSRTFSDVSPEVSIKWNPRPNVMVFGAYKEGFKSGSYDLSTSNSGTLTRDISFDAETASGGEIGVKSDWLENTLRLNLTAYRYEYGNLQLSTFNPVTIATQVFNAGEARVQGVEFELTWAPEAVQGLRINGSVNYNKGEFTKFIASCNDSQLFFGAPGCVERNGVAGFQTSDANDVAGKPLPYAPKWAFNVGASIDRPLTETLRYRGNILGVYSGKYNAGGDGTNDPLDDENGYFTVNAGLGVYAESGKWEVSFIGRNLTNEVYRTVSARSTFSTYGIYRAEERQVGINRARELVFQLIYRPW